MTIDHDDVRDLVDSYYLGGLDRHERQTVETHLETCRSCQDRAREAQALAHAFAQTLEPLPPPLDLRKRVLARAVATPQEGASHRPAPAVDRWQPASRRWSLAGALAAAATLAAMVTGTLAWMHWQQNQRLRAELQSLEQQVTEQQQQIAILQDAAQNLRQTSAILAAADLSRVDLGGQAPAPVARGRVFWSAFHGLVFSATDLPALPPGSVYQLWVVADRPHSAGIVKPDPGGNLNVVAPRPVPQNPKAFAVTIEPDGGKPAPTGPMFLLGSL
jgi:anti-sigma-K factor RskA